MQCKIILMKLNQICEVPQVPLLLIQYCKLAELPTQEEEEAGQAEACNELNPINSNDLIHNPNYVELS